MQSETSIFEAQPTMWSSSILCNHLHIFVLTFSCTNKHPDLFVFTLSCYLASAEPPAQGLRMRSILTELVICRLLNERYQPINTSQRFLIVLYLGLCIWLECRSVLFLFNHIFASLFIQTSHFPLCEDETLISVSLLQVTVVQSYAKIVFMCSFCIKSNHSLQTGKKNLISVASM